MDQWWEIELRSIQELSELQAKFEDAFVASGGPRGAAMFSNDTAQPQVMAYFSPKAAEIARVLLLAYPARRAIPRPEEGDFLVGNDEDKEMLPRLNRYGDVIRKL
jgi:hypothetical protein